MLRTVIIKRSFFERVFFDNIIWLYKEEQNNGDYKSD